MDRCNNTVKLHGKCRYAPASQQAERRRKDHLRSTKEQTGSRARVTRSRRREFISFLAMSSLGLIKQGRREGRKQQKKALEETGMQIRSR